MQILSSYNSTYCQRTSVVDIDDDPFSNADNFYEEQTKRMRLEEEGFLDGYQDQIIEEHNERVVYSIASS